MMFLHNDFCVSECPGSLIGDVANRICSENPNFRDPKARKFSGSQSLTLTAATNATEYKAVILNSTTSNTTLLTFGIKANNNFNRQRQWNYNLEKCPHSTNIFPFRVLSEQLRVEDQARLKLGTYSQCIIISTNKTNTFAEIKLENVVSVAVVPQYSELC
jgi:hypothetical protein